MIRWSRNLEEIESVCSGGQVEKVGGEGSHWHYHAEMELTWFRKGRGTRFVGDGIALFEAGEVILLGRNVPHYWHVIGESAGVSIQWNFPHGHPFWAFPESNRVAELFKRAERGLLIEGKEAAAVGRIMREILAKPGLERLGALLELLSRLGEREWTERDGISSKSFSLSESSAYRVAIEKAVRHIIANCREEVRLEDLLEITAMSRATFSRKFKDHTGRTFSEFLLRLRLETACRELLETNRTVTEVAYRCGFGQISFFNRSFRKAMGCSPMEYRKR